MIGALGDLVFMVSSEVLITYSAMSDSKSGRFATHEVHGNTPVIEWLGPSIKSASITIPLIYQENWFIPEDEVEKLRRDCDHGVERTFFLGDDFIGRFYITKVDCQRDYSGPDGNMLRGTLKVELMGYDI